MGGCCEGGPKRRRPAGGEGAENILRSLPERKDRSGGFRRPAEVHNSHYQHERRRPDFDFRGDTTNSK